jgi:hypothetical protein
MKELRRNELRDGEVARFANTQEGAAQDRQRGDSVNKHDGSAKSRPWLIAVPTAILVLVGIIWSGFWHWATNTAEATMTAWRAREAGAGRIYNCATTAFGGYPFRIEVNCAEPAVDDRRTALSVRAHHLTAVAQVWDPTLVIGEIIPPLAVGPLGGAPAATMDWTKAQGSLRGMPGAPERLSIVVDNPKLAAAPSGGLLAAAEHMELHGRFAANSTPGHPALDLALDARHATAPGSVATLGTFGPLASAGIDLSVVAVLHGVSDVSLKPLEQQLRQIQAANGRLDITSARLQQGDLIASATGALGLTPRGTLSGDVKLTVVNLARLVPLLGIDRMVAQAVPQEAINRYAPALDRLLPGLGGVLKSRDSGGAAPGGGAGGSASGSSSDLSAAAGAAMLGGQPAEFEGKRAVTLTLHFDDGVAFLGPLKLGQVPPLY